MGSKERQLSYSFAFKVEVINYAEKHGNRAAERHFGSPLTDKVICAPKIPKLEEYVKNWITDHRKNGIAVSMKMILIEARRLAIEMSAYAY
jgi:hypothetical protein